MNVDDLKIEHIRFDKEIWHPLDHRIGDTRCVTFQSNARSAVRLHALYWWEHKRDHDLGWLFRAVFCWWGHHKIVIWHRRLPVRAAVRGCAWCSFSTGWVNKR